MHSSGRSVQSDFSYPNNVKINYSTNQSIYSNPPPPNNIPKQFNVDVRVKVNMQTGKVQLTIPQKQQSASRIILNLPSNNPNQFVQPTKIYQSVEPKPQYIMQQAPNFSGNRQSSQVSFSSQASQESLSNHQNYVYFNSPQQIISQNQNLVQSQRIRQTQIFCVVCQQNFKEHQYGQHLNMHKSKHYEEPVLKQQVFTLREAPVRNNNENMNFKKVKNAPNIPDIPMYALQSRVSISDNQDFEQSPKFNNSQPKQYNFERQSNSSRNKISREKIQQDVLQSESVRSRNTFKQKVHYLNQIQQNPLTRNNFYPQRNYQKQSVRQSIGSRAAYQQKSLAMKQRQFMQQSIGSRGGFQDMRQKPFMQQSAVSYDSYKERPQVVKQRQPMQDSMSSSRGYHDKFQVVKEKPIQQESGIRGGYQDNNNIQYMKQKQLQQSVASKRYYPEQDIYYVNQKAVMQDSRVSRGTFKQKVPSNKNSEKYQNQHNKYYEEMNHNDTFELKSKQQHMEQRFSDTESKKSYRTTPFKYEQRQQASDQMYRSMNKQAEYNYNRLRRPCQIIEQKTEILSQSSTKKRIPKNMLAVQMAISERKQRQMQALRQKDRYYR